MKLILRDNCSVLLVVKFSCIFIAGIALRKVFSRVPASPWGMMGRASTDGFLLNLACPGTSRLLLT